MELGGGWQIVPKSGFQVTNKQMSKQSDRQYHSECCWVIWYTHAEQPAGHYTCVDPEYNETQ